MRLHRDYSLESLNSLRLPSRARYYTRANDHRTVAQASDWARSQGLPLLVLGGGSNLVLAGDFPGLVLHLTLRGLRSERRGGGQRLWVAAGEDWPTLVERCLAKGWYGLENLSLIPGSVGAAPVQNIGAYGVELAERIRAVRGWHRDARAFQTLSVQQCRFRYRDSIFKGALRDRFIITEVELELSRQFQPCLDYPALRDALSASPPSANAPAVATGSLSARRLADAVIAIRRSKLPDPAHTPNVGSFFKNPVLSPSHYQALRERLAAAGTLDIPHFGAPDGIKIPAAWLLQQAGWKGRRRGTVGMHDRQAVVLVNHGGATGADVLALADAIRDDIRQRYGIALEMEPRVY